MNAVLKELEQVSLVSVTFIHDYLQLGFSNGTGLTINNKYHWSTNNYQAVIGSKVNAVNEEGGNVVFKFSNGECLKVGFTKNDFLGPEGMLLYKENSLVPIIWDESYILKGETSEK